MEKSSGSSNELKVLGDGLLRTQKYIIHLCVLGLFFSMVAAIIAFACLPGAIMHIKWAFVVFVISGGAAMDSLGLALFADVKILTDRYEVVAEKVDAAEGTSYSVLVKKGNIGGAISVGLLALAALANVGSILAIVFYL